MKVILRLILLLKDVLHFERLWFGSLLLFLYKPLQSFLQKKLNAQDYMQKCNREAECCVTLSVTGTIKNQLLRAIHTF